MSTPPTTICLDWGGVIVRICSSFQQAAVRAGLELRPLAASPEAIGERSRLIHAYETGMLTSDAFFDRLSDAVGGVYTPDELRMIHDAWLIEEYPGARELIEDLRAAGLHTALLSNTNPRHYQRSLGDAFSAIQRLDVRLLSHELGLAKPDPRVFGEVRRAVACERIVYFDDRPEHVVAARAAGLLAHTVDPEGDPPAQVRAILADLDVLRIQRA